MAKYEEKVPEGLVMVTCWCKHSYVEIPIEDVGLYTLSCQIRVCRETNPMTLENSSDQES